VNANVHLRSPDTASISSTNGYGEFIVTHKLFVQSFFNPSICFKETIQVKDQTLYNDTISLEFEATEKFVDVHVWFGAHKHGQFIFNKYHGAPPPHIYRDITVATATTTAAAAASGITATIATIATIATTATTASTAATTTASAAATTTTTAPTVFSDSATTVLSCVADKANTKTTSSVSDHDHGHVDK
jgi:hypothetical protein